MTHPSDLEPVTQAITQDTQAQRLVSEDQRCIINSDEKPIDNRTIHLSLGGQAQFAAIKRTLRRVSTHRLDWAQSDIWPADARCMKANRPLTEDGKVSVTQLEKRF